MTVIDKELITGPKKTAGRRLFARLLTLVSVAVVTYFLQKGYEQDDRFWMFISEMLIYAVVLMIFLSQQTGRLKSGPDTSKVTYERLVDEDSSVNVYIGIYLFLLMILIVAKVIFVGPIEDRSMGPWGIYAVVAPIFVIIFWRQYKLESSGESSSGARS